MHLDLVEVLPLLRGVLALAKLARDVRPARAELGFRPRHLEPALERVAVVGHARARLELLAVVLHGRDVEGVHDHERRAVRLVLLAHEVDEGDVLRGELEVGDVPSEVVHAQRGHDPLAVVQLELGVDVEDELQAELHQLPHPLDLHRAGQDGAFDAVDVVHGDPHHAVVGRLRHLEREHLRLRTWRRRHQRESRRQREREEVLLEVDELLDLDLHELAPLHAAPSFLEPVESRHACAQRALIRY